MKTIQNIGRDSLYFFALLGIIFIPFPFHMISWKPGDIVFGSLISVIGNSMPSLGMTESAITSDSVSMYILMLLLIILAIIIATAISFSRGWQLNSDRILPVFRKVFTFYLALQLLKYGFDKIFKGQFYLPEPNILYTPLGQLSKDTLFWSAIGTSYLYSVITGLIEALAGVFLMFRKTRVLGLLLAVPVLMHVLIINLGFDISVKLYSAFLLFLSLLLLSPQLGRLYSFIVRHDIATLKREDHTFAIFNHVFIRVSLRTFVVGLIFLEALYPALRSGIVNDDTAERPYLHGAYEVFEVTKNKQVIELREHELKRFFIHRDGYIIFQDRKDRMKDFKLQVNNRQMLLIDYQASAIPYDYTWNPGDSILTLQHAATDPGDKYLFKAKAINWRQLPALKQQFHWTVEGAGENR